MGAKVGSGVGGVVVMMGSALLVGLGGLCSMVSDGPFNFTTVCNSAGF